ncbi:hypothetical protein K493DRAFT_356123 [Basidiobolus meristosporus CBS 931.73]|uniref:Uncharacterized protein n=1 Tax=Basidiobolus meristosporus CBS 931.73 TaxID=1314790 RepID=A0A1Y1XZ58_9FUNG|nr:hypothetical protein K493DRAFT_356123 [Basidiobolus meristosporus CBS 931.73]|eukprot:ORX91021.1 hypothetical protein K493DRAFT_356123 [Basidiobolus meristosporus CBS 931.73]
MLVILFVLTGLLEGGPVFWGSSLREVLGLAPGRCTWISDYPINVFLNALSILVLGSNVVNGFHRTGVQLSPYLPRIVTHHLTPFMIYCGCSFGYMAGRIILAHVTKAPFPFPHRVYIPLILGSLKAPLPAYFNWNSLFPMEYEYHYILLALAYSIAIYAHFAISVICEVCDYFDIWCLSIKHPKKQL